jgi:hypothetical protein
VNAALNRAFAPASASGATLELNESWTLGDWLTPNAEEIIAAAVSSVLIVIEVVSATALRARGNRGAQPRHYMVVLQCLLDQLAILWRASGR